MKKLTLVFVCLATLIACTPSAPSEGSIQTAIAQTQLAQPTGTPIPQPLDKPTLRPTSTPKPTDTPRATDTPIPLTATATNTGSEKIFSINYPAVQESGGIHVEIGRVLFAKKDELESLGFDYFETGAYTEVDVIGEIIFKITNTTDKVVSLYPYQATIVVGSEQIDLWGWSLIQRIGPEDVSGEIFPGVTLVGGSWFGVRRSDVPNITNMILSFDGPVDENFNSLGPDFYFELDLSNHEWVDMPDELK